MNKQFEGVTNLENEVFNEQADQFNFLTKKRTIYENDTLVNRILSLIRESPLDYIEEALKIYKSEINDLKTKVREGFELRGYESFERISDITKEKYKIEKKIIASFSLSGTDNESLKTFLEKYEKDDILTKQYTFSFLENEEYEIKKVKEAAKEFCKEGFTANSNTIKSVLKQIFLEKNDKPTKEVNFSIFEDIVTK